MQQLPPTGIGRAFTAELKRLSLIEDKTMEALCEEIARLVGLEGQRQLYNWRSAKWPLPSNVIPILCRRFKSLALLHALEDECSDVVIDVPDAYDLTREVSRTVRKDLQAYERYLSAFEADGIEPHELQELRELMEDVVRNAHRFLEIAATDCERRTSNGRGDSVKEAISDEDLRRATKDVWLTIDEVVALGVPREEVLQKIEAGEWVSREVVEGVETDHLEVFPSDPSK